MAAGYRTCTLHERILESSSWCATSLCTALGCLASCCMSIPGCRLQGSQVHNHPRREITTVLHESTVPDLTTGTAPRYQINHEVGFTSGQRAYSDYLQISDDITQVKLLNDEAISKGAGCMQSHGHQVCPCYVRAIREACCMRSWPDRHGAFPASHGMVLHISDSCPGISGCAVHRRWLP